MCPTEQKTAAPDTAGGRLLLRPHHGMCLAWFIGKGYSEEFSAHMEQMLSLLLTNVPVHLTVSTDRICEACPNNRGGACASWEKVEKYDRAVLAACGLEEGRTLPFLDFANVVQKSVMDSGRRGEICGGCRWGEICDNQKSRWESLCGSDALTQEKSVQSEERMMENMEVQVRRAQKKDTDAIMKLLGEVLELHAKLRPDIFISGTTKYTAEELEALYANDDTPVLVAVDEKDEVLGHAFGVMQRQPFSTNMKDFKTLYIDDICVDKNARGRHVGTALFQAMMRYAKEAGCYDVTLNVWEGNDTARAFYERMGMFVKETQMEMIVK